MQKISNLCKTEENKEQKGNNIWNYDPPWNKKKIYKTSIEKHLSDKGSTEIKHRAFSNDNKKYILKFRF